MTKPGFTFKFFWRKNWGEMGQKQEPELGFLAFIEKYLFFLSISSIMKNYWTHYRGWKFSYEIRCVHRSVFPSVLSFFGTGSLVFSETQHGVKGPYKVVCNSWIFLEKSPSSKNDRKWSKIAQKQGFWTFKENHVISQSIIESFRAASGISQKSLFCEVLP